MKRFVIWALCAILSASMVIIPTPRLCSRVFAQETSLNSDVSSVEGERRALLIAVSRYESKEFIPLPNVDNDLKLMKEELLKSNFKAVNIRTLQHSGNLPTRANILDAIDELTKSCGKDDLVFIMLTGHGMRNDDEQKDYFLPLDAKGIDFSTFVPLDYVINALESSGAKFKWLLVDACRSADKGGNNETIGKLKPKPGMLILQSSSPGEKSYFTDDEEYGLFIYHFVKGMQGGAIRPDGRVSVLGAFEYANAQIKDIQHPVISSENFADFVLNENEDWIHAAKYYQKALDFFDQEDYLQAQKAIELALVFDSPLQETYRSKAKTIGKLVALTNGPKLEVASDSNEASKSSDSRTEDVPFSSVNKRNKQTESEKDNVSSIEPDSESDEGMSIEPNASETSSVPSTEWIDAKEGAGRSIKIKGVDTVFRFCPSGSFLMGSSDEVPTRIENQHKVKLTQGFWIMETETTQKLWTAVMGENLSQFEGDDLPVENVSWDDCQEFVEKINSLGITPSGMKFALPTEAQWEYACRAGTKTAYPWGQSISGNNANYDVYTKNIRGRTYGQTKRVKSYNHNNWNLYNMCGNVAEWVQDSFSIYQTSTEVDPCVEDERELHRIVRGGCWQSQDKDCRSAARFHTEPTTRNGTIGFRCVLTAIQSKKNPSDSDEENNVEQTRSSRRR